MNPSEYQWNQQQQMQTQQQQLYSQIVYKNQCEQQQFYQWQQQYAYYMQNSQQLPIQQLPIPVPIQSSIQSLPPSQNHIKSHEIYKEKKFIFDTITFINRYQGITFGSYVVQHIINSHQASTYKQKGKELPQSKHKIPSRIEILIHASKCEQFLRSIIRAFAKDGYSLDEYNKGDVTKIPEYSSVILKPDTMYLNTITITVKFSNEISFIIRLNMFITNMPEYIPLEIPYGLFITEKLYISMSTDSATDAKYEMQNDIADTKKCINNIKKNITTYMPYYDYSKLPMLLKSSDKIPYMIDFNLSGGNYSDFAITNICKKTGSTYNPPCCSKCLSEIYPTHSIDKTNDKSNDISNDKSNDIVYYKRAITKCCSRNYHFDCLFENYVEDGNFKCEQCGIINQDTLGKNKEILMCLMGYF